MTPISKQEEKELIIRLIEGDGDAFEKIYYLYAEKVYYFSLRYLKNTSDTEEIVQEVFTRIWESRSNLDPDQSFSGYILTTAKNTIFNNNRKKVNHQAYCNYLISYLQKNMHNVENEVIYNDLMALLAKTVEGLPPKRREIFKLSRMNGKSYKEISAELGISEKTIETHMRLALRDIKRVIEPALNNIL